jgi:hypothetical protein
VPGLHLGGVRVLLNNGRHVLPEVAIAPDNIVVCGLMLAQFDTRQHDEPREVIWTLTRVCVP